MKANDTDKPSQELLWYSYFPLYKYWTALIVSKASTIFYNG